MSNSFSLKFKFGRKLRYLRRRNELTQNQLAELTGCSTEYISRMERGLVSPSFEIIEKLCIALNSEPITLFDYSDLPIKTH